MICKNCSNNIPDESIFCTNCGSKVTEQPAVEAPVIADIPQEQFQPQQQVQTPPVNYAPISNTQTAESKIPEEYQPLSAWAYFGYQLLFAIPIAGFILLIVFSCNNGNINRRNFARSYWCGLIIAGIMLAVYLIFFIVMFILGGAAIRM